MSTRPGPPGSRETAPILDTDGAGGVFNPVTLRGSHSAPHTIQVSGHSRLVDDDDRTGPDVRCGSHRRRNQICVVTSTSAKTG